jgi:DNA-binding transcriptional ArsR family regulator
VGILFGRDSPDDAPGNTPDDLLPEDFPVRTVSEETVTELQAQRPARDAVAVRPHRENSGIEGMDDFLDGIRQRRMGTNGLVRRQRVNQSPHHSMEVRYAEPPDAPEERASRALTLQYVPHDSLYGRFERQIQDSYPDSQIERVPPRFIDIDPGDYLAGTTMTLQRYTLYPIKHECDSLPGFSKDPTGRVLKEMAAEGNVDVTFQTQFRTAPSDWLAGVDGGPSRKTLRHNLTQPTYEKEWMVFTRERVEYPPSDTDKTVAKYLSNLAGTGWELSLRLFAAGPAPDEVQRRMYNTAAMFRAFWELNSEQAFRPAPIPESEVTDALGESIAREWPDDSPEVVKSQQETASVVNVPTADDISTSQMRWALAKPGKGVPPGTPRFDFDGAGVARGAPSAQAAMLDDGTDDPDAPFWYGYGKKERTEAGLFPEILDVHQFVGGGTGKGKTTFLGNFWYQIVTRGRGALFFDPKGMDAEDFVAMCPDLDPEDLVYIELGGDRGRSIAMNLLEVPGEAEPGTRAHDSAVETLVEDTVASIAQGSSGEENYWGVRMDRITQNLTRGLARIGHDATYLDLAFALDPDGLEQYAAHLADERREWLLRYAERHLVDMDDEKLEPLAGRLQKWIENPMLRELTSSPESTVSVDDVVRDGKIVVIRDKTSQQNAARLVASALLRRIWVAIQEQTHDSSQPDPPKFNLVLDEFNDIASTTSNIVTMLEEARSFGLSVTAACQDVSAQLPDEILKGIEGQCETFITYNPGRPDDAQRIARQHSSDIAEEDLMNLSKYRFYMRTHTRDDVLTHSYKVKAFPPAADVQPDTQVLSDEETERLIEQSLQVNGTERRTTQDIKEDSLFLDPDDTISIGDSRSDALTVTDAVGRAVVQGVYDTACRAGDPSGSVPLSDCRAAIIRRVARLDATPDRATLNDDLAADGDLWRQLVQHVPDDRLDIRERDGTPTLRAASPRSTLATVGGNQSAGGAGHGLLLWNAYAPLTWAGLDVEILDASGDDPDALVRPAPPAEQHAPALVERLTGGAVARLEAEHSTGRSKAGMTAQHVLQAATEGRQAVVLARPGDAANVADTLRAAPAYCRSDHPVDGEVRYYTSPRDVRIDGAAMTRPGGRANAWVKDEATGEVVLRDGSGTEYARFEDAAAVLSESERYPDGGDRRVKRPVIPEVVLEDAPVDPHAEIVAVPEDAAQLGDLSLVVDGGDGLSVPADAIGAEGGPQALDVSANAQRFYAVLLENCGDGFAADAAPLTATTAHEIATATGEDALDVSKRTIQNWLKALVDEGVLERERGEHGAAPDRFYVRGGCRDS